MSVIKVSLGDDVRRVRFEDPGTMTYDALRSIVAEAYPTVRAQQRASPPPRQQQQPVVAAAARRHVAVAVCAQVATRRRPRRGR